MLEQLHWTGPGYQPVVDFGGWRTALMNFHPKYRPDALRIMEAHRDTDEVFVLLQGRCTLFFGEGDPANNNISRVYAADMRPGIVYNVRKGAFHTHALSEDAVVLVVENRDTGDHNTDFLPISGQGLQQLETLARRSWAWE
ncbi:MAG: hypothetical protein GC205_07380 [Bacteroidetes bacterium]|nr:hypothetical protein [Bacteroidota bacterium]